MRLLVCLATLTSAKLGHGEHVTLFHPVGLDQLKHPGTEQDLSGGCGAVQAGGGLL